MLFRSHLQYLSGDDRELFGQELRRLRGLLGALVNENGLAQGEAEALSALNAHEARRALRAWALTSDRTMTRKELSAAFPTLGKREWTRLRVRKHRSTEDIPAYQYPVRWAAEIAPEDTETVCAPDPPRYRDAMSDKAWYSLDEMRDQEEWRSRQEESDEGWVEHM